MSEHHPLQDIREEASGNISRQASEPTLNDFKRDNHHEHGAPPSAGHAIQRPQRRMSTASRVSVDFFDPEGMQELQRTLTSRTGNRPVSIAQSLAHSLDSQDTLAVDPDNFDFDKTIRTAIRRRDQAEIKPRQLGVAFRNVEVQGIGASASFQPTLGSLFNPLSVVEEIKNARHPPLKRILSGFEGVVKPGEMLLVLGSPGAGCSTMLKTLANHTEEYHAVSGERHYDSISPADLKRYFRGDVQYCPEDDIHFPTLTVEQTIDFAATTRTPRTRIDGTRSQFVETLTTILTTVFGLRHVRKTPVGNQQIRGISGGQKKRVSIAEALATRACIRCWDNSTRGLDASTALEFVQALRIATDTMKLGTVVSIYQAGESLYKHFDKVCVIYEGRMAYFGPADKAKDYFIDMGYEPANRQTTPDFLVAVTDPGARIPRAGVSSQPRTADEFAQYFKTSKLGRENAEEVDQYISTYSGNTESAKAYAQSARAEFAKRSGMKNPYMLTIPQQVAAVMRRKIQIIRGSMLTTGINLFSYVFQGIIMGTVFLRMPEATSAFFSRGGVLFFALLFSALNTMAEIPALFAQREIVVRHEKAALYHPFVEMLAHTLVDIPIALVITIVFAIILYFMTGLQRSPEQFFTFLLFLLVLSLTMKSWFRAIAAAFKSEATAQAFAGVSTLALSIYTGYTIPKPSMIGALRWITYINPLRYGFEAVLTNEFRTLRGACSSLVPQGPGYENVSLENQVCAVVGAQPGQDFVDGAEFARLSYGFSYSKTWMNLGIVIAFGVGFTVLLLVFSEYNTSTGHNSTVTLFKRGTKIKKAKKDAPGNGGNDKEFGLDNLKPVDDKHHAPSAQPPLDAKPPTQTDIFTWQNIKYTVPISGEPDRTLLNEVYGYVAPGKLTALMGESGAGKTTLLNVLAKRVYSGTVTGDMLVNGQALPADFQSQTGYVQQMDTHEPTSTVREALIFSAKLRQPPSVPLEEKLAYVEKCIDICGLTEYAEAAIGSLNVEYKKRTTIAVELAAKPKLLLFLDEPTSGLDSQSAWAIVSFLRSLADQGQAILCTIHQPSAELFQVFDRLLLLKKGGQTVYFGDLGTNATKLINYFEGNGGRHCEGHENPAEYMLDVIGAGATASTSADWHKLWLQSPEATSTQEEIKTIISEGINRGAVETELSSEFATPWLVQVKELIVRGINSYWRNPTYLMAKLVLNTLAGLFIGFTFFKAKDTQQGTQNKLFAIFMCTILTVPLASQLMVPFINIRNVYEIRERPSRMYSWTALVTAQILVEIPWNIVGAAILFFTWFWTVGFQNDRAGYTYLMMGIVNPLYYSSIGQAVAAMSPDAQTGALLFSLLFSFVLTFNGVLQPFRQLGWWRWMYRLSPYTYLIEGLLGQALGQQDINCSAVEFVKITPPSGKTCAEYMNPYISFAGGYLQNPDASADCNFCSTRTTDQFLEASFNIYYSHRWRNVGIMLAFVVFNVSAIYIFTYLFRIRTGSLLPSFRRFKKKN
ncbi:hypothetical protein D9611_010600 [Ephemerocybe angulata]|uniref:ABC transporter domain-containing protein n=1 Tax=Ephemerocybe angulata TaxID=980116 RepID=A0A8H5BV99_9AGAR|nr:hypothetical protein D9611_010600 [Tulosesus angulatus]